MNITFTRTNRVRSVEIRDGKAYEVRIGGEFWGWVAGENRAYLAMAKDQDSWMSGVQRTKAQAVAAATINGQAKAAEDAQRAAKVPVNVKVVRLTVDNVGTEGAALAGWLLDGAEDLGEIRSVRMTRDGFNNAAVVGTNGRDVLGLPATVTAHKF